VQPIEAWSLWLQRIDNFYKRKPVEIGIPSVDPPDSMLAHENGGMRIMEQITCEMRKFRNHLRSNIRVPLCGREDAETG